MQNVGFFKALFLCPQKGGRIHSYSTILKFLLNYFTLTTFSHVSWDHWLYYIPRTSRSTILSHEDQKSTEEFSKEASYKHSLYTKFKGSQGPLEPSMGLHWTLHYDVALSEYENHFVLVLPRMGRLLFKLSILIRVNHLKPQLALHGFKTTAVSALFPHLHPLFSLKSKNQV